MKSIYSECIYERCIYEELTVIEKNLKSFENYQKECANLRKAITDLYEYKKK